MFPEPQKEHEWLQRLVGEWTTEAECSMGPDQPPMKTEAVDVVRSLGGLWVLCEGKGEMPGGGVCESIITLGYDPVQKKFVGTFIASVMTHLWIYNGSLDATGNILTLDTEGPVMAEGEVGKMTRYQDIIDFRSNDHRVLTSRMIGPDGNWMPFMTANYRRRK